MESSSAVLPSSALSVPLKLLDRVLKLKVNGAVYEYLVQYISAMVDVHPQNAHVQGPPPTPLKLDRDPKVSPNSEALNSNERTLPKLHDFIENISIRSRCTMSTMLVALIYLGRLQKVITLKHPTRGKPCARHRIIFSALMISHKIWNDSSMIGKHWAEVSNLFTSQEVLAMEREMLVLLRYDLELTVEQIWAAARPFLKRPFLSVSANRVAEAESAIAGAARTKHEASVTDRLRTLHQHQQILPLPRSEGTSSVLTAAQQMPPLRLSQQFRQQPSCDSQLLHPFSSLHRSPLRTNDNPPSGATMAICSSPAPVSPFAASGHSSAFYSSPLMTSPSLLTTCRPTAASHAVINLSRTQTARPNTGSTAKATTRLTVRNGSHLTVSTKSANGHPYLHNHPQLHCDHPAISPVTRLKKKKCIASVQRFYLPTGMHMYSTLRSGYSPSSPLHSSVSSGSNSSDSVTTSIPSSPSDRSAGSGISVYARSPSTAWQVLHQEHYNEHHQPYYSYASTMAPPPGADP